MRERGMNGFLYECSSDGAEIGCSDAIVDRMPDPFGLETTATHLLRSKLFVLLMDAADRAVSAFHWGVRRGVLPQELVQETPMRVSNDGTRWTSGRAASARGEVIARGRYDLQMARLSEFHPKHTVHPIRFDDPAGTPRLTLRRAFKFLTMDPDFVPAVTLSRPEAAKPTIFSAVDRSEQWAVWNRALSRMIRDVLERMGIIPRPAPNSAQSRPGRICPQGPQHHGATASERSFMSRHGRGIQGPCLA